MKKQIHVIAVTIAALAFLAFMVGVFVALFACGAGETWDADLYNAALTFALCSVMLVCLPSAILYASTL